MLRGNKLVKNTVYICFLIFCFKGKLPFSLPFKFLGVCQSIKDLNLIFRYFTVELLSGNLKYVFIGNSYWTQPTPESRLQWPSPVSELSDQVISNCWSLMDRIAEVGTILPNLVSLVSLDTFCTALWKFNTICILRQRWKQKSCLDKLWWWRKFLSRHWSLICQW